MTALKTSILAGVCIGLAVLGKVGPVSAAEGEAASSSGNWQLDIRRIGLELSKTDVKNGKEYENSPVSALNADSRTDIKGIWDTALVYNADRFRWTNALFMEYGKTKQEDINGVVTRDETADTILLSTDYAQKIWRVYSADVGPFVNGAYQTEFKANNDAPRTKTLRGMAGLKLFDGDIFEDLYIAAVGEYDMTYSEHVSKSAGEIGWRINYPFKEDVRFKTEGYYRRYFSFSKYIGTDLRYDLNLTARMDVNLTKTLAFGPYVSYRRAHDRENSVAGSNFVIGLSFSYIDLFNLTKGE